MEMWYEKKRREGKMKVMIGYTRTYKVEEKSK